MKTKLCKQCKKTKNVSEFHTDRQSEDNLLYCCKTCKSVLNSMNHRRIKYKKIKQDEENMQRLTKEWLQDNKPTKCADVYMSNPYKCMGKSTIEF